MGNTDKFEMIANIYDTPERIHIAKVSSEAIREFLADTRSKSAIDFGCGTGLVGMNLLNEFKTILFLDASQNMISQVENKISASKIQNADTLCFDFEKDNLLDLHADYIFMAQVLLHIEDYLPVLSKLYDVLEPGGHLIIIDFNKNNDIVSDMVHNGFDPEELSAVMEKVGYQKIRFNTFYTGNNIFMGHDASMFVLDSQK
ncbi:MAG: methyltransferase type 12 [Firmicutes bacterium]|nr:methyltransferase type 12 [Bacillota bacterium]